VPILPIRNQEQVSLAPHTTFRIGGPARYFCEVMSEVELAEVVQFARQRELRIFVLGGGSNLLIGDESFDELVLHIVLDDSIASSPDGGFADFVSTAGTDWNALVLHVCKQGVSGAECLAGIPGSVGGTPVQNVGACGCSERGDAGALDQHFDFEAAL
jgi:UDP-N-acetylmuramate dehydrogenase